MKKGLYIRLFGETFRLSACTFGGGFVIIPLMQRRFADELGWLTKEEILDMTAFARASPGAVTVNVAVQVGARMAGAAGALSAGAGAGGGAGASSGSSPLILAIRLLIFARKLSTSLLRGSSASTFSISSRK